MHEPGYAKGHPVAATNFYDKMMKLRSTKTMEVTMRTFVDPEKCLGCGVCEGIAPDVFVLGADGIAAVQLDPVPEQYWEDTRQAAADCPEEAITIEE